MESWSRSQTVQKKPVGVLRAAGLEYWSNAYRNIAIFLQNCKSKFCKHLASPFQEKKENCLGTRKGLFFTIYFWDLWDHRVKNAFRTTYTIMFTCKNKNSKTEVYLTSSKSTLSSKNWASEPTGVIYSVDKRSSVSDSYFSSQYKILC